MLISDSTCGKRCFIDNCRSKSFRKNETLQNETRELNASKFINKFHIEQFPR